MSVAVECIILALEANKRSRAISLMLLDFPKPAIISQIVAEYGIEVPLADPLG